MKGIDDFQKLSKENLEATMKSFGEFNKGFQAIATEMSDYSKKAFEEGNSALEDLISAKSVDQAFEVQTSFAKKAYDEYVSEMTKIGEMYTDLAKDSYKPVEKIFAKKF